MSAVLIVAHGQPSAPQPAEESLAQMAARVAAHLPEWRVASATLAAPGALAAAVARLGPGARVFPLFMAGGWFTRIHLPAQLAKVGAADWTVLEPFGCNATVQELAVQILRETGAKRAILAAHGSPKSPAPAAIAQHVAGLAKLAGVDTECGFIDQDPRIATLTAHDAATVCLPFFAASGGHVVDDLPSALAEAGFSGPILPALGLDPRVPLLIAKAIAEGQAACAHGCRWA